MEDPGSQNMLQLPWRVFMKAIYYISAKCLTQEMDETTKGLRGSFCWSKFIHLVGFEIGDENNGELLFPTFTSWHSLQHSQLISLSYFCKLFA